MFQKERRRERRTVTRLKMGYNLGLDQGKAAIAILQGESCHLILRMITYTTPPDADLDLRQTSAKHYQAAGPRNTPGHFPMVTKECPMGMLYCLLVNFRHQFRSARDARPCTCKPNARR